MKTIPDQFLDLLGDAKKAFACLATVMPDGSPQVTPVWFDYTEGRIRVNSARGRVKARNMREGAKVALAIMDPEQPYRYLQVRATIVRATEAGAERHIDSLAKKYLGAESYPFRRSGEVRVIYELAPFSAQGME